MSYVIGVCIGNSMDNLPKEKLGLVLRDLIDLQIVKQFSSFCKFHHHEDVIGRVEDLVEFDDIGVTDKFEDFDLTLDLDVWGGTLEIMFLLRILRLFRILMATRMPVRSWRASECWQHYP